MEIRKHQYIDVHYNENEQKLADKYGKYLERLGYELQQTDIGGYLDFCDQYIKPIRLLKSKDKTEQSEVNNT